MFLPGLLWSKQLWARGVVRAVIYGGQCPSPPSGIAITEIVSVNWVQLSSRNMKLFNIFHIFFYSWCYQQYLISSTVHITLAFLFGCKRSERVKNNSNNNIKNS